MRRWDGLVESYVGELSARGLASASIQQFTRELDRFGSWLKHRRPRPRLDEVGPDEIVRYLQGRAAFRAKSTVAGIVSILRGMGEFLVRQEVWSSNPLRWMRGPKLDWRDRVPKRISRSALKRLWQTAATKRQGYHRYLWVTLLSVLYGTGLRRGELERLDLTDWDREEGTLTIDGRKTGQARRVSVPAVVWRCLEVYLPQRQNLLEDKGSPGQRALFVNQDGGRLRDHSISRGVQLIARTAEVDHVTLHQFRHTCASDLLEDGVRLPEIQRILGHRTITTTVQYLAVADPQRHQAVGLHPINQMLAKGGVT